MAQLSSNWKKLQAKLEAETGLSSAKRKAKASPPEIRASKRAKVSNPTLEKTKKLKNQRGLHQQQMGGVHSSPSHGKSKHGASASAALWAADKVSSETIAEAYGLGIKSTPVTLASDNDRVNHGLSEGLEVGKYVALDCEMVGVGPGGKESALARVSIVDFHGKQVYDSFVKPQEKVTNWRTPVSGISSKNMWFARDFGIVQTSVAEILNDRILIGHDVKHDLEALKLKHAARDIRDTAKHAAFKKHGNGRKPALRILAKQLLGVDTQNGAHSSLEDARVTMLLFRKHKSEFDVFHANHSVTQMATKASPKVRRSKTKEK